MGAGVQRGPGQTRSLEPGDFQQPLSSSPTLTTARAQPGPRGRARPLLLALWEASEDTESLTPGEEGFRPNAAPQAEVGLGVPGPPAWL